ncbi:MAG: dynamin family protein, partial [Burkholderiales bacterium PBB5]
MSTALHTGLDTLALWRRGLDRGIEQCAALLAEQGLLDSETQALATALRQRLVTDRLVVAFVAEFSRGKSELINALFFADTGRRLMPATPGRTTMCPVELAWDPQLPPGLSLLPIATRATGQTVASLREQPDQWHSQALDLDDAPGMAAVLASVTQVQHVPVDQARALGFWNDEHPEDNPPRNERDLVEVPAWRHALINYPHPLLKRGLVVIDTPGLNAIGAEPELTLGLLPSAHATVYLLAADTGVTRSDLAVWRDHLGDRACERFVVLNKSDALRDPLLSPAQVEAQVQRQCQSVADTLGMDRERVFPLSARLALTARVRGDEAALVDSRLPALELALQAQLLPQRSLVIGRMIEDGALVLQQAALRRLAERQRHTTDQLFELKSLRGKSGGRVNLMSSRLLAETTEFERCVPRLAALRGVLNKQLQAVMDSLGSDRVRATVQQMRKQADASLLQLGASRAFATMGDALRTQIDEAEVRVAEIEEMLGASQRQINADFGFSLATSPKPVLEGFRAELERIEAGYSRYLGITQLWRRAQPGFMDQFIRMLLSKLRVVFESAAVEVELWVKAASAQMDEQLRERRRTRVQRREAFTRIQAAESELE